MATTKSSRKKPSKSSTQAVKTTKKQAVGTQNASARATKKTTLTPFQRIRSLHTSLSVMYAVFSLIVLIFVSKFSTAVTLGIQTRDQFASTQKVVLGPSSEVLFNIQPKYILAFTLLISALGSLLLATKLRTRYESTLGAGISGLRWVILGLSGALMIEFVSLLAGINDIAVLKLSAGLVLASAMLAWIAERDNAGSNRPKWLAYWLSLLAGLLALLPIAATLIGTSLYGMERFGWHVYALAGVILLGFLGLALNQYLNTRQRGTQRSYTAVEEAYMRVDMLTKFFVVLIVLLALK